MTRQGSNEAFLRPAATMALGTALSRATGVLRTFALAFALGLGPLADAYNLANTLPNVVHDLVIGGVLSATFVPVFVERLATLDERRATEAISAVVSVSFVALLAASVAFFGAAPAIVHAFLATGAHTNPTERAIATDLLRLFVPQLLAYGLISLATAVLNAYRRFSAPMFAPIVNNLLLVVLFVALGLELHHPTTATVLRSPWALVAIGAGTTAGVMAQALVLLAVARAQGIRLRFVPAFGHEAVRRIMRLGGWTLGFVVANQLALVAVLALAVRTGPGSVAAYSYAYTFFQLPYGLVTVSVTSAATPALAEVWSFGDVARFASRLRRALGATLALVVPAAVAEAVLARPLAAFILGHGAANPRASVPTAHALAVLALGLPGFSCFLLAVRALQAMQDTRSAFYLYLVENAANVILAVPMSLAFGLEGLTGSIAAAYSVAALIALRHLRVRLGGARLLPPGTVSVRVLAGSALLALGAAIGSNLTSADGTFALAGRLAAGGALGGLLHVATTVAIAATTTRRRASRTANPARWQTSRRRSTRRGGWQTPPW